MTTNSVNQQMSFPTEKIDVSIEKVDNSISIVDKNQEKEIKEVIEIINEAITHLDKALSKISTASDIGLFDFLCDGGCITSMIKQDKMEEANREIRLTNSYVKKLKEELKDVENIDNIEISNLLSFMDVFFDNVFSDIMVQNKIAKAERDCKKARRQLVTLKKDLMDRLDPKKISEIKAEKDVKKDKQEDLKAAFEACTNAIESLQKNIRPLEKAINCVGDESILCCFGCFGFMFIEAKVDKVKSRLRSSNRDLDTLDKKLKNVSIDITNRSEYLKFMEISSDIIACNGTSFDNEAGKILIKAKNSCLESIKEIESIRDELQGKIVKRNICI